MISKTEEKQESQQVRVSILSTTLVTVGTRVNKPTSNRRKRTGTKSIACKEKNAQSEMDVNKCMSDNLERGDGVDRGGGTYSFGLTSTATFLRLIRDGGWGGEWGNG